MRGGRGREGEGERVPANDEIDLRDVAEPIVEDDVALDVLPSRPLVETLRGMSGKQAANAFLSPPFVSISPISEERIRSVHQ